MEIDDRLKKAWNKRAKLMLESGKLTQDAFDLKNQSNKLLENAKKLTDEGDTLWYEAVRAVYGETKIEWGDWNNDLNSHECRLHRFETFRPDELFEETPDADERGDL